MSSMGASHELLRQLLSTYDEGEVTQLINMHREDSIRPLLRLRQRSPNWFKTALQHYEQDERPVSEYIDELDVRCSLFRIMRNLSFQFTYGSKGLNGALFAVVMVAPISKLHSLLYDLRGLSHRNDMEAISHNLFYLQDHAASSIFEFTHKEQHLSRYRSNASTATLEPSNSVIQITDTEASFGSSRIRKCFLTNSAAAEAVRLVPIGSSTGTLKEGPFEALLSKAWDQSTCEKWISMNHDKKTIESPQNLLVLRRDIHWWLDRGLIGLKPLEKTAKSVIVQLHWLKRSRIRPFKIYGDDFSMDDLMELAGLTDNRAWGENMDYRLGGERLLQTGQVFEITATDGEQLPSFELLKLRWDFTRAVAISGAAREDDLPEEEEETIVARVDDKQAVLAGAEEAPKESQEAGEPDKVMDWEDGTDLDSVLPNICLSLYGDASDWRARRAKPLAKLLRLFK